MLARARASALGLLSLWLIPLALVGQEGRGPRPLVIEGGTLIDGTGAPPVPDTVIVTDGIKITSISAGGTTTYPPGADVIPAHGKFILPGLIDGHAHWRGWSGELFAAHGVTTIVDLGSSSTWILAVKSAESAGRMRSGPRILTSGDAIARSSARRADLTRSSHGPPHDTGVDGPSQARTMARSLISRGTDVIKVHDSLTAEDLQAVTTEAHNVDLPVVGRSRDVRMSVTHGVDGITSLLGIALSLMSSQDVRAFEEGRLACPLAYMQTDGEGMHDLIDFLVREETYISPSLISEFPGVLQQARRFELANYELLAHPNLRYVPLNAFLSSLTSFRTLRSYSSSLGPFPYVQRVEESILTECRRAYRNGQEFLRAFARAGGNIFLGTAAGGSASLPGASLHQELELLVDAGLVPMQALQAATRNPAELFRQAYKLGTVERGKLADLLLLDADPLVDIGNIRRVHRVIKGGSVVDTSYTPDYFEALAELDEDGRYGLSAPVPSISAVSTKTMNTWSMVIHDGSPFDLTVRGAGFNSTSLVHLSGRPLETTFVSPHELRARVPTERIPVAGTFPVTVVTPWPGGGVSNVLALVVK